MQLNVFQGFSFTKGIWSIEGNTVISMYHIMNLEIRLLATSMLVSRWIFNHMESNAAIFLC